jgi:hypothetical protein
MQADQPRARAPGAGAIGVSVATTCVYGAMANPLFLNNVFTLPLFTEPALYFQVLLPPRAARNAPRLGAPGVLVLTTRTWSAQSFGVVPLLFCVHFAILPVERSMRNVPPPPPPSGSAHLCPHRALRTAPPPRSRRRPRRRR